MSINAPKRKRAKRVSPLEVAPRGWMYVWTQLRRQDVLLRLAIGIFAALLMWAVIEPWNPPFPYRVGYAPPRNIVATVNFEQQDISATEYAREQAANQVPYVFEHSPVPLENLRKDLQVELIQLATAKNRPENWQDFMPPVAEGEKPPAKQTLDEEFKNFQQALTKEGALDKLQEDIAKALAPYERYGILDKLPDDEGKPKRRDVIVVYPAGAPEGRGAGEEVPVEAVMIGDGRLLLDRLSTLVESVDVAEHVFYWIRRNLPQSTLEHKPNLTQKDRDEARDEVQDKVKKFRAGQTLAQRGQPRHSAEDPQPLTEEDIERLKHEYREVIAKLSLKQKVMRAGSSLGMILSLFALCGYYIMHHEPKLIWSLKRYVVILSMATLTVALAKWFNSPAHSWAVLRAEIIPLLFFAMVMAIAYRQDLSLLLSSTLALVIVFAIGHSLGDCIVLLGSVATAVFMLGRVRSRSKLIRVGFSAGLVAFGLTMGVGILEGQPLSLNWYSPDPLLLDSLRQLGWAMFTGFLVSGSLPYLERYFDVVTDISLLELGDVGHPLLQELVRRAPGTYNHSINVASLADGAAEAIGANGLLVRVGAYFHDIGKMLKPSYFVENQSDDVNRHDSLLPAMSTLIIIAHVKDGADLARQHGLPDPIIDFIEQHHGTTLVQYFYDRANQQQKDNPDASEVEESAYRYPGPKPQTKEAGVLMLADAVESASRVLAEPTPTRIRNLVEQLTMSRLMDGQFDECGLNLLELKAIQDSLVKSLIAVYHGRVKYPEKEKGEEPHPPKRDLAVG